MVAVIKRDVPNDLILKIGKLRNLTGYPNPVLIFQKVMRDYDWILNKAISDQSSVTQNQVSRIRSGKVDDCKVSELFLMLTVLPPEVRHRVISDVEGLWIVFDEITAHDPGLIRDLLGEPPQEIGD